MSTLTNVMVEQSARKMKAAISKFCRARVNAGLCEPDECDLCPCNKAYEMAEQYDKTEDEDNEVEEYD